MRRINDSFGILSKVLDKYLDCPSVVERPPPAKVYPPRENKRTYVKVSPQAAWALLEKARNARVSLRQALLVGRDGVVVACSEFEESRWIHKEMVMYYHRMQLPFVVGGGIRACSVFLMNEHGKSK